jgi:hypothetical protein
MLPPQVTAPSRTRARGATAFGLLPLGLLMLVVPLGIRAANAVRAEMAPEHSTAVRVTWEGRAVKIREGKGEKVPGCLGA